MDSQITSRISSLQRDLTELELRESTLLNELETVQSKIKLIKSELTEITKSERVANDILEKVYAQRRGSMNPKQKR